MQINNEQLDYLKTIVKGRQCKEIADLFNQKFNTDCTAKQIEYIKYKYGLKSGVDTRFRKNGIPHNKKKLHEETIYKNGSVWIKIEEPNTWVQKHIYIYEKHNGKIPKGYDIMFLDGDKTNCEISNLILVKKGVKMIAVNCGLLSDDRKLRKTGILTAVLLKKIADTKEKIEKERYD